MYPYGIVKKKTIAVISEAFYITLSRIAWLLRGWSGQLHPLLAPVAAAIEALLLRLHLALVYSKSQPRVD